MILLDGKRASEELLQAAKQTVDEKLKAGHRAPHLAAILVGSDAASQTYVAAKVRTCAELGFESTLQRLPTSTTEEELLAIINDYNKNNSIDGILVQLPLPEHIEEQKVIFAINPSKDVDGFHPISLGKMVLGAPTFVSATPNGIMLLLRQYGIDTAGKHCVVIGRSNIVGTPISILLSRNATPGNCTVTLCHSRTKDLPAMCRQADIIVAAIGRPNFVQADWVKEGAVVVDVGINRVADPSKKNGYRLVGDVDFEAVAEKASYITPVPGGVGKMTICALMLNTLKAAYEH